MRGVGTRTRGEVEVDLGLERSIKGTEGLTGGELNIADRCPDLTVSAGLSGLGIKAFPDNFTLVVMAGGKGERLAPLSTRRKPKPFLKLVDKKLSMLQITVRRFLSGANALLNPEQVIVVVNAKHVHFVKEQLPEIPESNIVGETVARSTGPAVSAIMYNLARQDPERIVTFVPADHFIGNPEAFLGYVKEAALYAAGHKQIVTLGIRPTWASPEYGYIRQAGDNRVERFVQKPDAETAETFLSDGGYLWNSGVIVSGAETFLSILRQHLPSWFEGLESAYGEAKPLASLRDSMEYFYGLMKSVSIDRALLEGASLGGDVAVIPMDDIGWSDVGTFKNLKDLVTQGFARPPAKVLKFLTEGVAN